MYNDPEKHNDSLRAFIGVIAHRLSTIQKAEKIIVMDRGEIKESGNHDELLKHNGYYAQLHQMQYKDVLDV